jgi:trans-aconitate methyltransferase
MKQNPWNADLYSDKHAFVFQLGAGVVELLAPREGERILDLGCGTGELTAQIAASGAQAVGFDASPSMLERARTLFPDLDFQLGDGRDFDFGRDFDAVFSNATLHWIADHVAVARSVARALKAGGRFVGEFGGQGNVARLESALSEAARELGLPPFVGPNTFPSLAEFAASLEAGGLQPIFLQLFERPTPLSGEDGARNWWRQFRAAYLQSLAPDDQEAVLERAERIAAPHLKTGEGWFADYVRLRFVALRSP